MLAILPIVLPILLPVTEILTAFLLLRLLVVLAFVGLLGLTNVAFLLLLLQGQVIAWQWLASVQVVLLQRWILLDQSVVDLEPK